MSQNQISIFNQKKKNKSNLSNYIVVAKRNSSLEEYNMKSDIIEIKDGNRINQDTKIYPETNKSKFSNLEENESASPANGRKNLTKDKLK